jgi:hypothetical protein
VVVPLLLPAPPPTTGRVLDLVSSAAAPSLKAVVVCFSITNGCADAAAPASESNGDELTPGAPVAALALGSVLCTEPIPAVAAAATVANAPVAATGAVDDVASSVAASVASAAVSSKGRLAFTRVAPLRERLLPSPAVAKKVVWPPLKSSLRYRSSEYALKWVSTSP